MPCEAFDCDLSRVLIVTAHPDDETIGLGGHLHLLRHATFVTVTDGSPADPADAQRAGCASEAEYADLRRSELFAALRVGGVDSTQWTGLLFQDQRAAWNLTALVARLRSMMERFAPVRVFTHPYEGGHPDHDATAYAVRRAAGLSCTDAEVWEFTSYHAGPYGIETGCFLPGGEGCAEPIVCQLPASDQERKRAMLACFASQQQTLSQFGTEKECFRPAPEYTFYEPPHPGRLFYENFPWGIAGREFIALCRQAAQVEAA